MSDLNPKQQEAIRHVEGPMLILAGAGSGKTRVVTYRIAHLLEMGILPSDIVAVTFTNKAAEEMRTRVRLLKGAHVLTSTFHSLGARILRESITHLGYQPNFTIYDEEDSEKLLKTVLEQLNLGDEKGLLRQARHDISSAKNDLISPDDAKSYPDIYRLYQKKLHECQALDFDDLLYLTVQLFQQHPEVLREYQNRWLFLLIDEYQDTNFAQYTLAKLLSAQHRNLFAVGDPDQSIYSWRGARYENILNFESDFPGAKVITLDQNYRSTNTILQAANALIEQNSRKFEKQLWSDLGEGEKIGTYVAPTERMEADFVAKQILNHTVPFDDTAIFYRTNAQSRTFEDALLSRKIPYVVIGGLSFYQRREVKDLLAFLKVIASNTDQISLLRTINLPRRGLGATTLEKISTDASNRAMPIFTYLEEPTIKLSTKQSQGISEYVSMIRRLRDLQPRVPLHELISETVAQSRYLAHLQEDPESFQERKENIDELIGKAAEWEQEQPTPSLSLFLEELSLNSRAEENTSLPSVKLMTLHNAKGLEFSLVFLVGLVEDLYPHINSKNSPESLEEERRLCYVGMTRAKRYLYLTASQSRYNWGAEQYTLPSRFLKEVPKEYLRNLSPQAALPQMDLSAGDAVFHQEFGNGVIQRVYQGTFGLMYDVYFTETETKRTLAAKYAKLQLL
jgi:DNA helicase-2/ATP-dependent DNA helicase PcrA